jgi:hypothetical protein
MFFLYMLKMDTGLLTTLSSNYDDKDEKPFPFSCFQTSVYILWNKLYSSQKQWTLVVLVVYETFVYIFFTIMLSPLNFVFMF